MKECACRGRYKSVHTLAATKFKCNVLINTYKMYNISANRQYSLSKQKSIFWFWKGFNLYIVIKKLHINHLVCVSERPTHQTTWPSEFSVYRLLRCKFNPALDISSEKVQYSFTDEQQSTKQLKLITTANKPWLQKCTVFSNTPIIEET